MTKLKKYFPMIRERVEILSEIQMNPILSQLFNKWTAEQQQEEYSPERLKSFLIVTSKMYTDIYNMCLNMERVMNMFSEELRIMDRNTVQIMLEDMGNKLTEKDATISEKDAELERLKQLLTENNIQIS